jgi:hypothetical protein
MGDQRRKFGFLLERVPGLPGGACAGSSTSAHQGFNVRQQIPVKWFVARRLKAALPNEGWEQTYNVGSWGLHGRLRDAPSDEHRSVV